MSYSPAIAESLTAAKNGLSYGEDVKREQKLAEANIAVGLFLTQGTADGQCNLPNAAGDVTESGLGISEYIPCKPDGTNAYYDSGEMVRYIRKGYVWCAVEDSATAGQTAFVRITAKATPGTHEAVGRLRSDADGADSGVATECTRLIFRSTQATAGGLALVEVNLP